MITTDLGAATAYAEAVKQGYKGTREDFGKLLAEFVGKAEQVATDKNAVAKDRKAVVEARSHVDTVVETFDSHVDKIAPGTANDDTLLYGVEVKFYNMEVDIDENLESPYKGLYIIGDGSGVTHSLSHASASGVYVARRIAETL